MKSFKQFNDIEMINESLNSPLEFEMTDDTQMPKQIFASFDIDDTKYGISLVLSNYKDVYMLDLYRIVNVKKRSWSFMKPNHIRLCLSTTIKFMEACYPFLQTKMKGILIELPSKKGSEKYVSFLGRILKKSYIKKFESIPVVKKTDKARNYMFLVNKNVKASALFKSAAFHKNFEFDKGGSEIFTSEMLAEMDPYKTMKTTVSITPSKKHAFGSIQVDLALDDEAIGELDAASQTFKINKKLLDAAEEVDAKTKKAAEKEAEPVVAKSQKPYTVAIQETADEIYLSSSAEGSGVGYFDNKTDHTLSISLPHLMAIILPKAFSNIKDYGYDESKIVSDDLVYAARTGFDNLPKSAQTELQNIGLFKANNLQVSGEQKFKDIKTNLMAMQYIDKPTILFLAIVIKEKLDMVKVTTAAPKPKKEEKVSTMKDYALELKVTPASSAKGFETANVNDPFASDLGFKESGEDIGEKKKSILAMPSIKKWYTSFDKNEEGSKSLHAYTGNTYNTINADLRNQIKNKFLTDGNWMTKDLVNYFDQAPELDAGIWTYRNANTPSVSKYEVGDDYIDAGVMSTSVDSSLRMGAHVSGSGKLSNTRLKIFLPKGTKCFPILGKSSVQSENEIVLPPFSMLRIIESYENYRFEGHRMFVCTMIGSGLKSYSELSKGDGTILENKNSSKKDDEDKWSSDTTSYEDAMRIKTMLLSKKTKKK